MKRILHLTLKKKWFDLIASGNKKIEYRECKDYWAKRFLNKKSDSLFVTRKIYDEIYFRNGYSKSSPFIRVEWKGLDIETFEGKLCYAIKLGDILEISQ